MPDALDSWGRAVALPSYDSALPSNWDCCPGVANPSLWDVPLPCSPLCIMGAPSSVCLGSLGAGLFCPAPGDKICDEYPPTPWPICG
jgi:hypothetical protein